MKKKEAVEENEEAGRIFFDKYPHTKTDRYSQFYKQRTPLAGTTRWTCSSGTGGLV